jgi:hypothetical protein
LHLQGSKGIGIPVVDPESINDVGALAGFLWQTATVGAFNEANKVQLILPGIAMLANHHPQLSNCKLRHCFLGMPLSRCDTRWYLKSTLTRLFGSL